MHIGWDYVAGKPSVNGFPIDFDPKTGRVVALEFNRETGKYRVVGPVPELSTREEAGRGKVLRYSGVEVLPPSEAWRRAFGNAVRRRVSFFVCGGPGVLARFGRAKLDQSLFAREGLQQEQSGLRPEGR